MDYRILVAPRGKIYGRVRGGETTYTEFVIIIDLGGGIEMNLASNDLAERAEKILFLGCEF